MAPADSRKTKILNSGQGYQLSSDNFDYSRRGSTSADQDEKHPYNILVERLWKTFKHKEVYLRAFRYLLETEIKQSRFLWRYCLVRPYSSLGGRTPH